MKPFDLEPLLAPGLSIFIATVVVAFWVTRSPVFSMVAAFIKSGIFLIYFGLLFDGTFTFLDDWSYLEGGGELYAQNVGLANLSDNWEFSLAVSGGDHFMYYLHNAYAFRIFGEGYYAPVALNILLTLLVAWFGTYLAAQAFGLAGVRRKCFFGFLLLHPDILAWSNIMNGKDILVLLLHVLLLLSCWLFFSRRLVAAIALAVPVSLVLSFTRFYVPPLFAMALLASLLLCRSGKGGLWLFLFSIALAALVLAQMGSDVLQYALAAVRENFVNPFYGFVRIVLTPIPFNTDPAYGFLDLPALIHWLLFPFACWGAVVVHRLRTQFSRFFLLYVLAFLSLYAVFGELQGPRHRVQLDYAWAVLQFAGVMAFLPSVFARRQHKPMQVFAPSAPVGQGA
jgi:hypothetical protein